jgi:phosphoglycerate dehydrogenase-like enzyme
MDRINVVFNWNPSPAESELLATLPPEIAIQTTAGKSAEEIDAIYAGMHVFVGMANMEILEKAKNLRLVQGMGHGVNKMPDAVFETMKKRGIALCKNVGSAVAIAEYMMMAMMVLSRRILIFHNALAAGNDSVKPRMSADDGGPLDIEMSGKALAVIGLGSIGVELCKRAKAFEMRVIGVQRVLRLDLKKELGLESIYGADDLHKALAEADFVGVTVPLTAETENMFDAAAFEAMKKNSYIVNVGRAQTINEDALYAALQNGKIAGAALDVWDNSKIPGQRGTAGRYPASHPLHQYNVLMTPHMSGVSVELRERRARHLVENVIRLAGGKPLKSLVDLDARY